ncbi:IS66 family transposase [bacterium]|nr:IS66 family transposase [bacterium]
MDKDELIVLLRGYEKAFVVLNKDNDRLRALNSELEQKHLFLDEKFITIKNKLFGKSSERSRENTRVTSSNKDKKRKVQLPSERYPGAPLIERHITLDNLPKCKCCGIEMPDSGMTEESEYLTKVPAQYYVVVQIRHKYACRSCHEDIVTAPSPARITPGGAYSDELMIDTAVSKYCDLIPIDRLAKMASREGIKELPPQSLIEGTHQLADFITGVYERLKSEMLSARIWHADETPHRMLEGDKKSHWFLWGFLTKVTSYFEYHDTRSGDVAIDLLSQSKCEYLISDAYTGYNKAVSVTNKVRGEKSLPLVRHVYCNAHARRKFIDVPDVMGKEAEFFIKKYRMIYRLEKLSQKYPEDRRRIRKRMLKYFEKMWDQCLRDKGGYSNKSKYGEAINYFINHYADFIRFIEHDDLPIDNNPAERLLRSAVIGRKTWYGTHSRRGAETAAILFSIMESCKLNKVNPREYLKNLVQDLHQGKNPYTPKEYADLAKNN